MNKTTMLQCDPEASELPQLLFWMKSWTLVPVMENPEMLKREPLVLASVTTCATLEIVTG
jgi:hypothetical protein